MRGLSLSSRILLGAVSLVLVLAAIVQLAVVPALVERERADLHDDVRREARLAAEALRTPLAVADRDARVGESAARLVDAAGGRRLTVVGADFRVVADTAPDGRRFVDARSWPEIAAPGTVLERDLRAGEGTSVVGAAPVVDDDGRTLGFARVAVSAAEVEAAVGALERRLLIATLVAGLAILGVVALWARRLAQPVRRMAEAVETLGRGGRWSPVDTPADDEIGRLARALDEMSRQLGERIDRVERDRVELQVVLGSMSEGVVAVDRERRVVLINGRARRLLDVDRDEPRGAPIWEITRVPEVIGAIERSLESGARETTLVRVPSGDEELSIQVTAEPLEEYEGQWGCVAVLHDLTDVQHADQVRRDFVANVSHELKTPLTAMRGYLEAVIEDAAMPDTLRASFLQKALRNTERLVAIVTDLLSLARVESEGRRVPHVPLDLNELVRASVDDWTEAATGRGIRLREELAEEPLVVEASEESLALAVGNLLSNAIKYSPSGSEVLVSTWADDGQAWIEVRDQGPGIPPHAQTRIFERFYRIDRNRSRALGGTGLGLSIVKNVIHGHGGAVSVESRLGMGSAFRVRLPRASGEAALEFTRSS